jgi:hypothetical protein
MLQPPSHAKQTLQDMCSLAQPALDFIIPGSPNSTFRRDSIILMIVRFSSYYHSMTDSRLAASAATSNSRKVGESMAHGATLCSWANCGWEKMSCGQLPLNPTSICPKQSLVWFTCTHLQCEGYGSWVDGQVASRQCSYGTACRNHSLQLRRCCFS